MSDPVVRLRNMTLLIVSVAGPGVLYGVPGLSDVTPRHDGLLGVAAFIGALVWFFAFVWLSVIVAPSYKPPPR